MSHTPGPWFRQSTVGPDGSNHEWVTASENNGWRGEHYLAVNGCISQEDGRLIQSAPDLLAAIEEINTKVGGLFAAMGHGLEIGEQVWDEAFAALEKGRQAARKARGEA